MILSATLSKPSKICEQQLGRPYIRIKIRYADTSTGSAWFAEFFTKTQAFHKKFSQEELKQFLQQNTGTAFLVCTERTETEQITILTNKKGKITTLHKKIVTAKAALPPTPAAACCCPKDEPGIESIRINGLNRTKNYIIPEGTPVPFLVCLGIMTDSGKIIAAKYDKFRQINRFLEYINDILPDVLGAIRNDGTAAGTVERPLRIIDFGCGKAYLTFAVQYFLTTVKKLQVEITGLDLKKDVVSYCSTLAGTLHCSGLTFETGDISDYVCRSRPDIVITLHACDTATDYALASAVKNGAKAILSVPCCQHELNKQITENKSRIADSASGVRFGTLLRYGIIRERFAALTTDALRAEYLEEAGYTVQILEFIDMSHTPKNLLIRAVLKNTGYKDTDTVRQPSPSEQAAGQRADRLTDALCVSPTLRGLLRD